MPGASGRVLVVDDNKVIRQLIRVNLELEGFEVVTAADGAECLDVVHQVRPDVITLDVVMPRLDGLRTAALLRADPRTRALPLLIVSGCSPREVESGCEVAVDGFLAKPFEPAELVRVVCRLLEGGGVAEAPVAPVAPVVRGGFDDVGCAGSDGVVCAGDPARATPADDGVACVGGDDGAGAGGTGGVGDDVGDLGGLGERSENR